MSPASGAGERAGFDTHNKARQNRRTILPATSSPGPWTSRITNRFMHTFPDPDRLERAYQSARAALLAERGADGHWVGELSTSALSTAVAVSALALVQQQASVQGTFDGLIRGGLAWLAAHQNADGGWGDTVLSFSNISTTMLCRAAFHITSGAAGQRAVLDRAEAWLGQRYGTTPEELAEAIRQRYGKDRTFSVPILMTSALAGLVSWREVPSLPFELACFPQSWFRFLQLPVVSYALPALIAIGQAVYHHRPPWNPLTRLLRWAARAPSLRVLQTIQPSNGGFLEAAPLTSFVALGLASSGRAAHPVVAKCVEFLVRSVRADGSWPIDTNLATWVTTLSVNAVAAAGDLAGLERQEELLDWLLEQQYRERHPFTGAAPGAWAWTPLPGGVPDADDTPGALLALANLASNQQSQQAVRRGLRWLSDLQNRDGGWPTFCRGWTGLPFDRSGSDLTAHALRALAHHGVAVNDPRLRRGLAYLERTQRADGSWLPLWFGNQHAPDDINPTYGTARVLAAYRDLAMMNSKSARQGLVWLLAVQNADGGWGGDRDTPSSIEETALALEVLVDVPGVSAEALNKGLHWLVQHFEKPERSRPTPIGFYFAKLWYFERLYPIIFTVAALGRARPGRHTPDNRPLSPATD
jgi:squalene-hopene/tetraprenyl-beta-curcumene cyclase